VKFTDKEVLRVFATADRPLSTVEVAQACRRAAEAPERAAESKEVRYALDQLAARGVVVSGTRDDPALRYLVPGGRGGRFWATPTVAAGALAAHTAYTARVDAADESTVMFKRLWVAAGGPPYDAARPNPDARIADPGLQPGPDRPVAVNIRLSDRQLTWLLDRLR
jgi:hypothetical protein